MAHRTHHAPEDMYSDVKVLHGHMVGTGASGDLTYVSGDVLTGVDSDVGDFDLTFKHKYPQGLEPRAEIVGPTEGLRCQFKAWDPEAGTAEVTFLVGSTPTDPTSDDHIYFRFEVRNSAANPRTEDL